MHAKPQAVLLEKHRQYTPANSRTRIYITYYITELGKMYCMYEMAKALIFCGCLSRQDMKNTVVIQGAVKLTS